MAGRELTCNLHKILMSGKKMKATPSVVKIKTIIYIVNVVGIYLATQIVFKEELSYIPKELLYILPKLSYRTKNGSFVHCHQFRTYG